VAEGAAYFTGAHTEIDIEASYENIDKSLVFLNIQTILKELSEKKSIAQSCEIIHNGSSLSSLCISTEGERRGKK
jgi:hypothetical protein